MNGEEIAVIQPVAGKEFVETPFVKNIVARALYYLKAGFPIHFRGISGTGKTTLALRVAELLARPAVILHGDEELTTSDLVGAETGRHFKRIRDNFIASVLKEEEETTNRWIDNRLTVAVERGYTLIYDEFTRSRPEANNVLLAVLQEGILDLPSNRDGEQKGYLKTHPQFHAIFTSNPEEYAGVHRSQDALRDRMITLDLNPLDQETECQITMKKSGLSLEGATRVVKIVRHLRDHGQYEFAPTVRGCIMIAKTVREYGKKVRIHARDPLFKQICFDILTSETSRIGSQTTSNKVRGIVKQAIERFCRNGSKNGSK